MLVVCLIKEHVLSVTAFSGPLLENALFVDAVFRTETLPVDGTHLDRLCQIHLSRSAEEAHFGCHIAPVAVSLFREALYVQKRQSHVSHFSRNESNEQM